VSTLGVITNPLNFNNQSIHQPKFCTSATWNSSAATIVDNMTGGANANIIFIDASDSIYVSSDAFQHIAVWINGNNSPSASIASGLNRSRGLFISSSGDIYIDNGAQHARVEQWNVNGSGPTVVMHVNGSCTSLFLGPNDTLYCSISEQHQVWSRLLFTSDNESTVVAGRDTAGTASDMLYRPLGIFVKNDLTLYVADCGNHRVQQFEWGNSHGTTVFSENYSETVSLECPSGIMVDADGYLFILDIGNHRIFRSNFHGFRCIIGCNGQGAGASELDGPSSFSFDSQGNIFVVDRNNDRIQKFSLASNTCGECDEQIDFVNEN
jgi:sugar lactone lactonase YvrE